LGAVQDCRCAGERALINHCDEGSQQVRIEGGSAHVEA
jgi:hypothetical protein